MVFQQSGYKVSKDIEYSLDDGKSYSNAWSETFYWSVVATQITRKKRQEQGEITCIQMYRFVVHCDVFFRMFSAGWSQAHYSIVFEIRKTHFLMFMHSKMDFLTQIVSLNLSSLFSSERESREGKYFLNFM